MVKKSVKQVVVEQPKPFECGELDGFKKFSLGVVEYLVLSKTKKSEIVIPLNMYLLMTPEEKKALKKSL